MNGEIELVSDGDGVAIFGDPREVDLFLNTAGVAPKEIALHQKFTSALNTGSGAAQVGPQIAANLGRWVKLTEESAKALKLGRAMKGSSDGVSRAIAADVLVLNEWIGIDTTRDAIEAKRWIVAVGEAKDRVVAAGGKGVGAVRRFGMNTVEDAKVVGEKLGQEFGERMPQRRSSHVTDVDDEQ